MNKLIKKTEQTKEKPFPKLMKSKKGQYVYFREEGKGVQLLGEYIDYCDTLWNMHCFEDTDDQILLNCKE